MNKNIIIAILIVVIIAIGAAFVLGGQTGKMNTQINIINNETFQNGEHVDIELKDAQGNALTGKQVDITFNNQKFSVTTDQYGKCYLTISGVASGKYDLEVKFAGDDKYNGCDSKASISVDVDSDADNVAEPTIGSATTASTTTDSSNSSSSSGSDTSGWTYYAEWDAWVDSNGIVRQIGNGAGEQMGVGMPVDDFSRLMHGQDPYHVFGDDNDTTSSDVDSADSSSSSASGSDDDE